MRPPVPCREISVVWSQDLVSWERQVRRPVIVIGVGDQMVSFRLNDVNILRRELDEVVMDIEEARTWI